ncbi:MAG: DUF3592 domain-containing protein [Acidobacteriia bacterium]|nr:DUF3592 domain-containing protein [Terriglobia bacterium]
MTGLLFILVGLLLCAGWYFLKKKSQAAMQWPSAQGRVIASDVNRYRGSDGEWAEEARVVYEYVVGGNSLRGNRITFGNAASGNRAAARKTAERYPAGAAVSVFYDPQKPGSAVLERKMSGALVLLPIVGGVFAVIGIMSFLVAH